MRIQILSDLHVEFHRDGGKQLVEKYLKPDNADVLIIAGDLACGDMPILGAIKAVCRVYKDSQVLYVPGNHEFYGTSINGFLPILKRLEESYSNLKILYNNSEQIGKYLFAGTTLWFAEHPDYRYHSHYMNDFRYISRFSEVVFNHNKEARKFIKWHMGKDSVIITHHAPSMMSVPDQFKTSPMNMFYVSDMEKDILRQKPRLWVHGHTHNSFNYMLGETHVICNPLGYVGQEINPSFIPNLIVETDL